MKSYKPSRLENSFIKFYCKQTDIHPKDVLKFIRNDCSFNAYNYDSRIEMVQLSFKCYSAGWEAKQVK
jgi:hypothetical protein